MPDLTAPFNEWQPRAHQVPLWTYLERGGKRAVAIWHRRAGKDEVCLHSTATQALKRVGNYWHCLPEFLQGRKAIWTAINPHTGKRRIDEAFPHYIREGSNDNEMFIRFKNGSTWQVIGSDRYDTTVGSAVVGITYSEWALANPAAWAYHRPILEENNGWANFITTPRGHNHAKSLYEFAQKHHEWFAEKLTVRDTRALSEAQIKLAIEEYVALYGEDVGRAQFDQEYLCDFNAAILGAFYAMEMRSVRAEGRVGKFEHDPNLPVHTAWDIGVDDDTAIWWFQVRGAQIFILDCYCSHGVGVDHYADVLTQRRERYGWKEGVCYVPHDAKVREWGTGRTRVETMQRLSLKPELVRDTTFEDGVNACRRMLPLAVFHERCEIGISALEQYHREWDQDTKSFGLKAKRDWTTHYADAARYLGLSWKIVPRVVEERKREPGTFVIPPPPDYYGERGIRL